MRQSLVLTIIGPDHPGLVERLSEAIASNGGNWEQGRMAHLDGQFAGLLRVVVPEAQLTALGQALDALEGLKVVRTGGTTRAPASERYTLRVVGQDHEGIVRDLSHALSRHGVNVEELSTGCESAPMTGESLFRATAQLCLPTGLSVDALREDLESLGDDMMIEVLLTPPG